MPAVVTYAGLAVSSLVVAGATASTHSCLPTERWLRLSRPGCLVLCQGGLPVLIWSPTQALTTKQTGTTARLIIGDQ